MSRSASNNSTLMIIIISLLCSPVSLRLANAQITHGVLLDELDISKITQGTDRPRSTGDKANLSINRKKFLKGIHTRTESRLYFELDGKVDEFSAMVGVDDRNDAYRTQQISKESSSAEFYIIADGKVIWQSGIMKFGDDPKKVKITLTGIKNLLLRVTGGPGNTHVDWVDAGFTYSGQCPKTVWSPEELAVDRSNIQLPFPRINGAMVIGIRPNTPFYYPVAATGDRPMSFMADGLPEGLVLDAVTGIINGIPARAGEYKVKLTVTNKFGKISRDLKISVGDKLALTPPMGFLSWNVIEGSISATVMREIADAFVNYGFRDVGYQYVIMDDCWEGGRDEGGNIFPDKLKFPDGLKCVGDYLHEKGLKIGIYSSPGPTTCAGYPGSLDHEDLDVKTWTSWGIDYLKYDYCSVPPERARELYILMGNLLEKSGRSILYSIGAGDIGAEWGKVAGAHLWRTAGDIRDQWFLGHQSGIIECFDRQQPKFTAYQHPGAWNDPDMLLAGIYGKGASANDLDAKGCNDTEYRSQMSLWAMLSAPLLISADVRNISRNALEILTNPEVIEVDQDPAGRLPWRLGAPAQQEVWVKDMEDGSKTVVLLNRSSEQKTINFRWEDLGLKTTQLVRDLWSRKDLGIIKDTYSATVPPHGVNMIRIYTKQ
jgi:alpha-galactosidase